MRFIKKNRHFLLMAAGCIAMFVAVFAFTTMTSGGSWGVYLLLLLCPAMHFLMHRGLHDNDKRHQSPHAHLSNPERKVSVDK
jgi:membrane protein DedA with SNARE-associated domain